MHILHLNPTGQLGGAETSLYDLLANLRRKEPHWKITLLLGEDGPLVPRVEKLGVRVMVLRLPEALARFGDSGLKDGRSSRAKTAIRLMSAMWAAQSYRHRLAKVIRTLQPDVLHATGFKMHLLSAWSKPAGMPLIWHFHDYVRSRPLMSRLIRGSSRFANIVLANSNSVAADVQACCGLPVTTFYNFLNIERFTPDGPAIDLDRVAGLPARPDVVRVGLVATFARWKGHGVFLKALAALPASLPFRAYIVGGPIYATDGSQYTIDELKGQAEALGLGDRIGFTGFVQDSDAVMRSLDVVVHASTKPEPMGMAILEGMASGKAVVASHDCGAAELFEHGRSALVHQSGDANLLAEQVRLLISDADLRERMGTNARLRMQEVLNASRQAEQLTGIYMRARSHGRRSPAPAEYELASGG